MYISACSHGKFGCGSYTTQNAVVYYGMDAFSVFMVVLTVLLPTVFSILIYLHLRNSIPT